MDWDDHYTTHNFQGLYLIQTELHLQAQLNEMRSKQELEVIADGQYFILFNIFILSFSNKYYSKEIMWTITEREK
jgi:hypothetical protein